MRINIITLIFLAIFFRVATLNFDLFFLKVAPNAFVILFGWVYVLQNGLRADFFSTQLGVAVIFVMMFSLVSSISSWINGFPVFNSIMDVSRLLVFFLLIYIGFVCSVESHARIHSFAAFLCILLCVGGVLAFIGLLPGEEVDGVIRPIGFLGTPQVMAHMALFSVIYFFFMYYQERSGKQAITKSAVLYFLALLFSIMVVMLTSSLKNVALVPFGMLLLSLLMSKRKIYAVAGSFFLMAIIGVSVLFLGLGVTERLSELVDEGINFSVQPGENTDNSLEFRIVHSTLLIGDWYENFFLHGTGIGNSYNLRGFGWQLGHNLDPHNDALKLFLEFGVIMASILFLFLLLFLRMLYRFSKVVPMAAFCLTTILVFSAVSMAGKVFFTAFNLYIFPFFLGICMRDIECCGRYRLWAK